MVETIIFRKSATGLLLTFQLFIIILYFLFVKYDPAAKPSKKDSNATTTEDPYKDIDRTYPIFQDIHVMIFVGFGFLMTFLKKYAYSAVGFSFLLAAISTEWAILINGFMNWGSDYKIYIGLEDMIFGEEAAAAVLISLGILLGKVPPFGLVFMTIVEIVIYVLNDYLCSETLKAMDWGGSVYIHAFGAYFGLGVSSIIAIKTKTIEQNNLEYASYFGDVTAMIGTLFLWVFWPSFLAGGLSGDQRYRAIINTYLSIIASCVVAFAISSAVNKEFKFSMIQIQNATLAGGVAIGTTCNAMIYPFGALIIGSLSGVVSCLAYRYIQDFLRYKCYIHDTCGAHNLHGLPGLMGGISGIFTAGFASRDVYGSELEVIYPGIKDGRSRGEQAGFQAIGIIITFNVAIFGGILTGVFLRYIFPQFSDDDYYKDDEFWTRDEEEEKA